jgi:hypothetical protein|tara:strand:- start:3123 stop:3305 length:183 start_codon:yes stop_codon:yes gene_type:complete
MTIIKEDNRIGPGVCCKCGDDAKINHGGKWYCAVESNMGVMNLKGFCIKERKGQLESNND